MTKTIHIYITTGLFSLSLTVLELSHTVVEEEGRREERKEGGI
jgi:hypothetical protein